MDQHTSLAIGRSPEKALQSATAARLNGFKQPHTEEDHTMRTVVRFIRKQGWIIALGVVLGVLGAITITAKTTRKYDAAAHIAISKEANANLKVNEDTDTSTMDYNLELDTQASIIRSTALALQVIKNLELYKNPAFVETPIVAGANHDFSPAQESALLSAWYGGLNVSRVPHTRIIEVRFTSKDPKLSAAIVNALTAGYVEHNFRAKYESTLQATDWLSHQLDELQLKVQKSEQALIDYQKSHGFLGLDEKQNITTDKLSDLNKDLTVAETERIARQATYEAAQKDPTSLPALTGNMLFQRLRENETDLERQAAQLQAQFGPAYPKVIEVNNQLKQARASVHSEIQRAIAQAQQEYLSALGREKMLRAAFEQQKGAATTLRDQSIEFLQLKQEANSNRALYESLSQKLKEAKFTSSMKVSNISVVDNARVPAQPSSPNSRKNLLLGTAFGLIVGICVALLATLLDRTLRTAEEVESLSGLPSLGSIPLTPELAGDLHQQLALSTGSAPRRFTTVAFTKPRSKAAEAYRALRTSILLSSIGKAPQVIMLTSSLPQEGKTTTSVNTAIVLAQKGSRVLLIDADMRRPSLHNVLGVRSKTGLSSLLSGSAEAHDCIFTMPEVPGLDFLPAGPHPPNPADLLDSGTMSGLLAHWRKEYDFIVLDTPPVLSVTDAVLLSPVVDSVILVTRSARTTRDAMRRATDLFAKVNVRVLGVVVNAVNWKSAEARYYGYAYRYAADAYYDDELTENAGTFS